MNGPIGKATPHAQKPVVVESNLDLVLKQEKKLMEVVVLAQVQWQKIATPKTVQVSIFSSFCYIRTNAPKWLFKPFYDQFGLIQNIQRPPIPETSFL